MKLSFECVLVVGNPISQFSDCIKPIEDSFSVRLAKDRLCFVHVRHPKSLLILRRVPTLFQ